MTTPNTTNEPLMLLFAAVALSRTGELDSYAPNRLAALGWTHEQVEEAARNLQHLAEQIAACRELPSAAPAQRGAA